MQIKGFQKLTLLDYPGKLGATIFTGGCNFRCGFCHNASLVLNPNLIPSIDQNEVLETLKQKKKVLQGICITGGEPLLQKDLEEFIIALKEMGYLVKLDTNGSFPERLKLLIDNHLIDYVAMDVKNSLEKYHLSTGINNIDTTSILKSINLIKENKIPYEFRTTTVKEHHTKEDFIAIGKLLKGAERLFLQAYSDSPDVIKVGFHAHTKEEMIEFKEILSNYIKEVELRGID